jgi:hypothetical protein
MNEFSGAATSRLTFGFIRTRRGRTCGQTRQMRQRASSRTTAVGRPQLTPGIHQTRSHDCAWYTCRSRCWSEFIKNFGIGFCRRAAHTPSLGDLTPLHVGPLQKETAPARGRAEAVGGCALGGSHGHRSHKPPGGRASCPYAAAHVQLVLGAHEMRGHQRALFTGEPGRQHYRAARSMSCRKAY